MAYCCLFLFGKIIQRVVFGDLRASELQVSLKVGQFVAASKQAYFPWFNWLLFITTENDNWCSGVDHANVSKSQRSMSLLFYIVCHHFVLLLLWWNLNLGPSFTSQDISTYLPKFAVQYRLFWLGNCRPHDYTLCKLLVFTRWSFIINLLLLLFLVIVGYKKLKTVIKLVGLTPTTSHQTF